MVGPMLHFRNGVLHAEVQEVDACRFQHRRSGFHGRVAMEELYRDIGRVDALEIRQSETLEVPPPHEAHNVVEQEDAVDGGEQLALVCNPGHEKIGDDVEQPVHALGLDLERLKELRRAHEKRSHVEGSARHGEADFVTCLLHLRQRVLEPLDDKGQKAVLARVGWRQAIDFFRGVQHLHGEGKVVLAPD